MGGMGGVGGGVHGRGEDRGGMSGGGGFHGSGEGEGGVGGGEGEGGNVGGVCGGDVGVGGGGAAGGDPRISRRRSTRSSFSGVRVGSSMPQPT